MWELTRVQLALSAQARRPLNLVGRKNRRLTSLLDDLDGSLTRAEAHWLYHQTRALPQDAVILELNAGEGKSTCCLAFGCWGSRRHVYTLWPDEAGRGDTETGQKFVSWHQNVIRKHLVPYVTPVLLDEDGAVPSCPDKAALFYVGQGSVHSDPGIGVHESILASLPPGTLIVQYGDPLFLRPLLGPEAITTVDSLSYGYWPRVHPVDLKLD